MGRSSRIITEVVFTVPDWNFQCRVIRYDGIAVNCLDSLSLAYEMILIRTRESLFRSCFVSSRFQTFKITNNIRYHPSQSEKSRRVCTDHFQLWCVPALISLGVAVFTSRLQTQLPSPVLFIFTFASQRSAAMDIHQLYERRSQ